MSCYGFYVAVQPQQGFRVQPGDLEGKQTIGNDFTVWIQACQLENDLSDGFQEAVVLCDQIVGANHQEDNIRICNFSGNDGNSVQESLGSFARYSVIEDNKVVHSVLPVKIGNE